MDIRESEGMRLTDYKRMVSYMYQYENGVKGKNVGYARIEAKNGQLKITLHMQLLGQLDSIFPTYLIQRTDNDMELIYLGDSVLKNQVIDSKHYADENNIMGTGFKLSDMGGMLIFLNEYIFFASNWDDKPILANEVLEALKPKEMRSNHTNNDFQKEQDSTEQAVETGSTVDTAYDGLRVDIPTEKATTDRREHRVAYDKPHYNEEISEVDLTPEQQASMPKYKLPRGWKTIERMQYPRNSGNSIRTTDTAVMTAAPADLTKVFNVDGNDSFDILPDKDLMDMFNQPEEIADTKENSKVSIEGTPSGGETKDELKIETVQGLEQESVEKEKDNVIYKSTDHRENVRHDRKEREAENEQPDHPTAQKIFERYPRIYPFEDNEIILCVKIMPKDVGLLPKEYWPLSSNSFLMHGYYCYHHLIFAKIKDRYGCRYILGVPGIYHNRERFMAKMFGFECFKSIRKKELKQGDFGYWYQQVIF